MKFINSLFQDPFKVLQAVIIGSSAAFVFWKGFDKYYKKPNQKVITSGPGESATPQKSSPISKEELQAKYGSTPDILKDNDANEYVVADPSDPENYLVITPQEIFTLTGAYPDGYVNETEQQLPQEEQPAHREVFQGTGVIGPEDYENFQDEVEDPELAALNQRLDNEEEFDQFRQQEGFGAGAGPGPATTAARQNRIIGAKKAKSLERKDQKRAYNEYMRDVTRAKKAEEEDFERQYSDLIALEREERNKRNDAAEQERKERLRKQKEEEEKARLAKEEMRRNLEELKIGDYLPISSQEEVSIAHGVSGAFVVNNESFVVRLSDDDLNSLANEIQQKGNISYQEIAQLLTSIKA